MEPKLAQELRALRGSDLELLVQPILLVANPGQFALEVLPRATTPRLRSLDTAQLSALARRLGAAWASTTAGTPSNRAKSRSASGSTGASPAPPQLSASTANWG